MMAYGVRWSLSGKNRRAENGVGTGCRIMAAGFFLMVTLHGHWAVSLWFRAKGIYPDA